MNPLILFHASCTDGYTAAWVANRYFDGACELQDVRYDSDPPDVTGRTVYILDFSYKRGVLQEMAEQAHDDSCRIIKVSHEESEVYAGGGVALPVSTTSRSISESLMATGSCSCASCQKTSTASPGRSWGM